MDWESLLQQIKQAHEALIAIQDDMGSSYSDRAFRNEALVRTIAEAIEGQVKHVLVEKDAVMQECRAFIARTISMRKAMGERLSIDDASAERIEIQKVCCLVAWVLTAYSHMFKLFSALNKNIARLKLCTTNVL
jgi:hypothetical protein